MPDQPPPGLRLDESVQVLAARHGSYYPAPPPALQRHLELPPFAEADGITNAYEAWCQLYESMVEDEKVPAVREKHQQSLLELRALRPEMEAHVAGVQLWRLLGEANSRVSRGQIAESVDLLRAIGERIQRTSHESLKRWHTTLFETFTEAGGTLAAPPPPRPVAPPPAPNVSSPPPSAAPPRPAPPRPATASPAPPRPAPAAPAAPVAPVTTAPIAAQPRDRPKSPRLRVPARAEATVGEPFRLEIAIDNLPARVSMNGVPTGLAWQLDGVIRGRPRAAGTFRVTVHAESGGGRDSATFQLDVHAPA